MADTDGRCPAEPKRKGLSTPPPAIDVPDRLAGAPPVAERTIAHYLLRVAKLGGYLARAKDPPPGNLVLWRGLSRLTDILLGFELNDRGYG